MAAIWQMTISHAFSWMKMIEFRFKCHWNWFSGIQSTINQHWFRIWRGAEEAKSHYLYQWWPSSLTPHICVSELGQHWCRQLFWTKGDMAWTFCIIYRRWNEADYSRECGNLTTGHVSCSVAFSVFRFLTVHITNVSWWQQLFWYCMKWFGFCSCENHLHTREGHHFNPSVESNYIHYKVWDEITYPNGATIEV